MAFSLKKVSLFNLLDWLYPQFLVSFSNSFLFVASASLPQICVCVCCAHHSDLMQDTLRLTRPVYFPIVTGSKPCRTHAMLVLLELMSSSMAVLPFPYIYLESCLTPHFSWQNVIAFPIIVEIYLSCILKIVLQF